MNKELDLIDRNELVTKWEKMLQLMIPEEDGRHLVSFEKIIEKLKETPTVELVRYGKWEEYEVPHIICCSECDWGTGVDEKHFKYCPNCGAKMDGE